MKPILCAHLLRKVDAKLIELLRSLGCDEYQGYYKSKPLPAAEFQRLLLTSLDLTTQPPLSMAS